LTFLVERLDYLGKPRQLLFGAGAGAAVPGAHVRPPAPVQRPDRALLQRGHRRVVRAHGVAHEIFEDTPLDQALKTYRLMMLDKGSPLREYCSRCHYWANSFWQNGRSPFSEIHNFDKPKSFFKKIKNAVGLWE
jgi:hypothetical protein